MPPRAKSICRAQGCNGLINAPGYCEKHEHLKPKAWGNRSEQSKNRLGGRARQRARDRLFQSNPLCVHCELKGLTALATERDHIIPLAEGGTEEPSNTQGLCTDCHKAKTQQESIRARAAR
jgi:5-methylcytosine-specific restriction protein A